MAKTKKSFDYKDPFPCRFRNLIEEKGATLDALAAEFNTTRQTVSNWQNGVTVPDAVSICDIARYFGVTTDYLLGLTDVKTIKTDMRAVAEYIHLSDKAVEMLHESDDLPYEYDSRYAAWLKDLLSVDDNALIHSPAREFNHKEYNAEKFRIASFFIEDCAFETIINNLHSIWIASRDRKKWREEGRRKLKELKSSPEKLLGFYRSRYKAFERCVKLEEFDDFYSDPKKFIKFKKYADELPDDVYLHYLFPNSEHYSREIEGSQLFLQKILQNTIDAVIEKAESEMPDGDD